MADGAGDLEIALAHGALGLSLSTISFTIDPRSTEVFLGAPSRLEGWIGAVVSYA